MLSSSMRECNEIWSVNFFKIIFDVPIILPERLDYEKKETH